MRAPAASPAADPLTRLEGSEHKFEVRKTEVDVIPFGDIEDADRTITWPDDLDSPERFDLLAADMGGLIRENRSLLAAYRQGFA